MSENLTCCCCGGDAGKWEQHWNRDDGYGICPACVAEEKAVLPPEEIESNYGKSNVNYDQPIVRLHGRKYMVLAATRDEDTANAFMERTPKASVLTVFDNGLIIIADSADKGVPIN